MTRNANVVRLMRDTAFPQAQKGAEAAHGTDHHPATRAFGVTFLSRNGPVSFLRRKAKGRGRLVAGPYHATNAPTPGKGLKLRVIADSGNPIYDNPIGRRVQKGKRTKKRA